MSKKFRRNILQVGVGLRCVMLSIALITVSAFAIYSYLGGATFDVHQYALMIATIVSIAVVLAFEIRTYVLLYNDGVRAIYKEQNVEIDKLNKFKHLVEHNEFTYNFQPIVDAKNGDIYAYEVLMRTRDNIGLKPLEVLKYAEISNMLYDVEHHTFFNALRYYKEHIKEFGSKKIFINSIPSVILSDEELEDLRVMYSEISDNIVVEILENASDDDQSIAAFDNLRNVLNCNIAVDDYGSGYSNDMKLLNNNPNYIKIDMSLITSIDTDSKKQLLVSNLIKFGKKYNVKILAEGVETKEELSKLIELGVDLIQGFYTARPASEVVAEIPQDISEFIIAENVRLSKFDNDQREYNAADGEIVNLFNLSLEKYAMVNVAGGKVHFVGTKNHVVDMVIRVLDNASASIIFENVNIKGAVESTVQLGNNSTVEVTLIGSNTFNKEGIYVPETASLFMRGDGDLTIKNNRNNGVGIGASFAGAYGSITIDMSGKLLIDSCGDKVISVGGGIKGKNSSIRFINGDISIKGRGIIAVGIGSASGDTEVYIGNAKISTQCIANEAVSIGTIYGKLDVTIAGILELTTDGERIVGVGALNGGSGRVAFTGGSTYSAIHGDIGSAIGSLGEGIEVNCAGGTISVYSEGTRVSGIGGLSAGCKVSITGGTVKTELLSAEPMCLGSLENSVVITGGNVVLGRDNKANTVNEFGEELTACEIDNSDSYEEEVVGAGGNYVYKAERDEETGKLCVFLPKAAEMERA